MTRTALTISAVLKVLPKADALHPLGQRAALTGERRAQWFSRIKRRELRTRARRAHVCVLRSARRRIVTIRGLPTEKDTLLHAPRLAPPTGAPPTRHVSRHPPAQFSATRCDKPRCYSRASDVATAALDVSAATHATEVAPPPPYKHTRQNPRSFYTQLSHVAGCD